MTKTDKTKNVGVYIHIPFCISKCSYCDFYSLPCKNPDNSDSKQRYCISLARDICENGKSYDVKVSSVFIGGGTPTVLTKKQLILIIGALKNTFEFTPNAEFTAESNPATFDKEKLTALKKAGVNRLSIGMQSACKNELSALNRIHSFDDVTRSFLLARECGFDNINLDLMYGIPFQTIESFEYTLSKAIELSPEHISVYGLQLEEGTPLYKNREKYVFPSDDAICELNQTALEVLSRNGYHRYEISNYSKAGYECKHNLNYWNLGEYLGFGTGAHSYFDGRRFYTESDLKAYSETLKHSDLSVTEEILDQEEKVREYVMLRLRLTKGVETRKLLSLSKNAEKYLKSAKKYISLGLMEEKNGFLHFTPSGFNVSNAILSDILF